MINTETFRRLALSFPETNEQPHFEKTSFRVNNKIFATLDIKKNLACLMLSEIDQSVFSVYDSTIIYPVPNKWGKRGATYVDLKKVRKSMIKDAEQNGDSSKVIKLRNEIISIEKKLPVQGNVLVVLGALILFGSYLFPIR